MPWSNNYTYPADFTLTHSLIETLVRACPNVRDLELVTPRAGADEAGAGIHRALGRLPRLDRLSLLLDCASGLADMFHNMDRDCPTLSVYIRDSISKFSISRVTASDIFETLCRGGAPGYIRIFPVRVLCEDIRNAVRVLAEGWVRVRDPREGDEDGFRMVAVRATGDDGPDNEVGGGS